MEVQRATFPVVVHAVLEHSGRWFLLRRANTGYLDGTWTLPGGHLHAGEGVIEAAARECREEAGVEIASADLSVVAVMPYRAGDQQGVDFIARATGWEGTPRIGEPARFDNCRWADPALLPAPAAPFIAPFLDMQRCGDWFRELHD